MDGDSTKKVCKGEIEQLPIPGLTDKSVSNIEIWLKKSKDRNNALDPSDDLEIDDPLNHNPKEKNGTESKLKGMGNIDNQNHYEKNNNLMRDDKTVVAGASIQAEVMQPRCTIKLSFAARDSGREDCIDKLKDLFSSTSA